MFTKILDTEAVVWVCSVEKVGLGLQLYEERDSGTGGFPVNFAKFLGTPFFTEHLWWLLLLISAGFFKGQ